MRGVWNGIRNGLAITGMVAYILILLHLCKVI